jgi:hypothetical protein
MFQGWNGFRAMANMLIEFADFPQEREIVGTLLIAYGEIEWAIAACVQEALDITPSAATRILFRVQGEGARLNVADAIVRPVFAKVGLEGQWGHAIGAAKHCKNIRNQYAHCHWRRFDGIPRFINLDAEARAVEGTLMVDAIPLKLELLQRQRSYFIYALDWLYYLAPEYKKQMGRLSLHDQVAPKSIPKPPLYDRQTPVVQAPQDTAPDSS